MAKKKILLLSDDIRMHSGISTMARELVFGTIHEYDWINLGGAIQHPEEGKVIELSQAVRQMTGVADASVKIYPVSGYGNEPLLDAVMEAERPDVILHFTDPRFWGWLYAMEKKIRAKIPLTYLTIWDDLPYPMWNKPSYESCDALFSISKQTKNIVENVLGKENCLTEKDFTVKTDEELEAWRKKLNIA